MRNRSWVGLTTLVMTCLLAAMAYGEAREGQDRAKRQPRREVLHPKVGEVLDDFTLKNIEGESVSLSQFRGKKIFVLELGACT